MDFSLLENAFIQAQRNLTKTSASGEFINASLLHKIPANTQLRGVVSQVQQLTQAQRETLLQSLAQHIKDLELPSTSARDAARSATPASDLLSARDLLHRPRLFLIQIQTSLGRLLSYSDTAPALKQSLFVKVTESGQLRVQNTMPSAQSALTKEAGQAPARQSQIHLPTNATLAAGQLSPGKPVSQEDIELIQAGLRRYLPEQKPLSESLAELGNRLLSLQRLKHVSLENIPRNSTLKLLFKLVERFPAAPPPDGPGLRRELGKSGQFFEHALLQAPAASEKAVNGKTIKAANAALLSRPGAASPAPSNPVLQQDLIQPDLIQEDLKNILLRLEQGLSLLSPTAHPPPSGMNEAKSTLLQALNLLLKPLIADNKNSSPGEKTEGAQWIEKTIRPLIRQMIARISTMQLNTLQGQIHESGSQSYQFDLPLRLHEHYMGLLLELRPLPRKEIEQDKKQKKEKAKKTKRLWQATLELDLANGDTLTSMISASKYDVQAHLWSDSETTRDKINKRLSKLRAKLTAAGINIDEVSLKRCNSPDKSHSDIQRGHSLIDTTT